MVHGGGGGGWEWTAWRGVFESAGLRVDAPDLQPAEAGKTVHSPVDGVQLGRANQVEVEPGGGHLRLDAGAQREDHPLQAAPGQRLRAVGAEPVGCLFGEERAVPPLHRQQVGEGVAQPGVPGILDQPFVGGLGEPLVQRADDAVDRDDVLPDQV